MLYNEEIIPLVLMILDSILAICANDNAAHESLNIHFINTAVNTAVINTALIQQLLVQISHWFSYLIYKTVQKSCKAMM